MTGRFEGTATFGPYILESSGNSDIFLAKLGPDGNWLWAIKAGGAENDWGRAVGLDSAGNPWLSGAFSGNVGFGPYILSSSGLKDVFVAKLDQFRQLALGCQSRQRSRFRARRHRCGFCG